MTPPLRHLLSAAAVALLFGFAAPHASALTEEQRSRASELFTTYRTAMTADDRDAAAEAIKSLVEELPAQAAAIAHKPIFTDAETLTRDYIREVETLIARNTPRELARNPEVVKDRALLAEILQIKGDDLQKKRLAEEGWPAVERLQKNLMPDPLASIKADADLSRKRDAILFRLSLCDDLAAHAKLPPDTRVRSQIEALEAGGAGLEAIASSKDKRVLESNRKTTEKGLVPEGDVLGINDANRIRMLAGLPALLLDPDLCKAALIHSKDMAEHGFFAHESPVPGRKTPWDRASEAGTTANAENIAMGQQDTIQANKSWFLSPGHFRNFFGDFNRIGLAAHEKYYTQLFGK